MNGTTESVQQTDAWRQAVVIRADGSSDTIALVEGDNERIDQLKTLVGGYIEAIKLRGDRYMIIHDEEKMHQHRINQIATLLAGDMIGQSDYIAGTAVIVSHEALN